MNIEENDYKVYKYTVYWQEMDFQIITGSWKKKTFSTKKEAKIFARKYRKQYRGNPINPYILKHIGSRSTFRKDVEVEKVPSHILKKLPLWGEYIVRIWY